MKINTKSSVFAVLLLSVSACSNKQVYDFMQDTAKQECRHLQSSAYRECIEIYSENYESYAKKRDEQLGSR